MTNELFVVLSFGKNFCKYKDKNIMIYGKGPKTKLILDVYPDYNIIGIMDGTLKEGSIYDKPVLNIDSLSELRVDVIIAVAQINTTALIYDRIKEYCYYRHIELYSISGKNLFEYFGIGKIAGALRYQCCEEADFVKAISAHDYIIADIMDVILMRKVIFEEDRFSIIEEKLETIDNFYKIERGTIVNIDLIRYIDYKEETIIFRDFSILYVSKIKLKKIEEDINLIKSRLYL